MVTIKKQKKQDTNINSRLALVIKSGKYTLGYKSCLKGMRSGRCKHHPITLHRGQGTDDPGDCSQARLDLR
jgi:hypothetical protein